MASAIASAAPMAANVTSEEIPSPSRTRWATSMCPIQHNQSRASTRVPSARTRGLRSSDTKREMLKKP